MINRRMRIGICLLDLGSKGRGDKPLESHFKGSGGPSLTDAVNIFLKGVTVIE